MNRIAPLAFVIALACAACSRDEPAPAPAPEAAPAQAPAAAVDPAPAPTPAPSTAPAAEDPTAPFDKSAFAGAFAGGGLRLELHADGTYGLEAPDGASQGTWTHEPASQSVRLDPGSKTATDRVFRMTDRDTLAAVDANGQPAGASLRRQATP